MQIHRNRIIKQNTYCLYRNTFYFCRWFFFQLVVVVSLFLKSPKAVYFHLDWGGGLGSVWSITLWEVLFLRSRPHHRHGYQATPGRTSHVDHEQGQYMSMSLLKDVETNAKLIRYLKFWLQQIRRVALVCPKTLNDLMIGGNSNPSQSANSSTCRTHPYATFHRELFACDSWAKVRLWQSW